MAPAIFLRDLAQRSKGALSSSRGHGSPESKTVRPGARRPRRMRVRVPTSYASEAMPNEVDMAAS